MAAIGAENEEDDVGCDDPEAVKHMIRYFYYLDYQADLAIDGPVNDELAQVVAQPARVSKKARKSGYVAPAQQHAQPLVGDGDVVMHAKVFAAAVKYQVPALKALAAAKIESAVQANWDH